MTENGFYVWRRAAGSAFASIIMGNVYAKILKPLVGDTPQKILVLGLDNAGSRFRPAVLF
jgi:hypothetical protein